MNFKLTLWLQILSLDDYSLGIKGYDRFIVKMSAVKRRTNIYFVKIDVQVDKMVIRGSEYRQPGKMKLEVSEFWKATFPGIDNESLSQPA